MAVGNLTILLNNHGIRVGDLTQKLWMKGIDISYQTTSRYCRASDASFGKTEIWGAVKECLDEMGLVWETVI